MRERVTILKEAVEGLRDQHEGAMRHHLDMASGYLGSYLHLLDAEEAEQEIQEQALEAQREAVRSSIMAEIEAAATPEEVEAVKKKWYKPSTWGKKSDG